MALTPISPWNVTWAKTSCGLRRVFGTQDNPLVLQFEQFEPGHTFQLTVTGKHLRPSSSGAKLSIRYGEAGVHEEALYRSGRTREGATMIVVAKSYLGGRPSNKENPVLSAAAVVAIDRIEITQGRTRLLLVTGALDRAFAELRKCTDQLVATWGLDPQVQRTRSRPPMPTSEPGRWLSPLDYPAGALNEGQQSIINFRLTVGSDGAPTACQVQASYSGELFERRTCQLLMSRARFEPALDANAKAITSYYVNSVFWILGD